ncbi:MAG: copper chaperone [Erysipelotrichaceae bacterium]|nr:copper chaperone [Erysipelotrichaceae bacterium]MDD4641922.1 copper chaperone [Erysipelotrichaceae bacterium]
MKHILFVSNLKDENDVRLIKEALDETRVEYEIVLSNQCVVINGRNDIVHAAKTALIEAGFIVK